MDRVNVQITVDTLRKICPATQVTTLEPFVDPINATFAEFGITEDADQQRFLAQVAHESGGFTTLSENLHYSARRLAQVWGKRFSTNPAAPTEHRVPNTLAYDLAAKGPEAIANNVYANRMGNGNEASGDGWRHRGAGLIQTTGKENQAAVADHFKIAIENVGAWMRTPEGAARSAGLFWERHHLSEVEDFAIVTKVVNGGVEGLSQRYAALGRAKEAFA